MKSTPRVPEYRPLMAIRYKYNSREVLGVINAERGRITEPGDPYLSCFSDNYSNVSIRPDVLPPMIGRYFNACNKIKNKNRMGQFDLALDKYWLTHSDYFRLTTTLVLGMGTADEKTLFWHGVKEQSRDKKIPMLD